MDDVKRAFVTGWPVEHSRSPIIHNYWLKRLGLKGEYVKRACAVDEFPSFLKGLNNEGFVGGNVTIPHKEMAFKLAEQLDSTAQRLGAVNTLWFEDGILQGSNTDGYGFLANLDDRASGWDDSDRQKRGALVLGAGGAARAIIDGLIQRGYSKIYIANRTLERAEKLAHTFGPLCEPISLDQANQNQSIAIIINTTSIGMKDDNSPLDLSDFSQNTVVNDIVYTPLHTPLLKQAEQLGMIGVDGLGMLLHQAVPGFEHWFGIRPQVTQELRELLLDDLGEAS